MLKEEDETWCCGLTKEHLEAFIYWAITCWNSRFKSGRANISYMKYKPLHNDIEQMEEDSLHAKRFTRGPRSVHGDDEENFNDANEEGDESSDEDEMIMLDKPADVGYNRGSAWFKYY